MLPGPPAAALLDRRGKALDGWMLPGPPAAALSSDGAASPAVAPAKREGKARCHSSVVPLVSRCHSSVVLLVGEDGPRSHIFRKIDLKFVANFWWNSVDGSPSFRRNGSNRIKSDPNSSFS
jgi:hypothetical protein